MVPNSAKLINLPETTSEVKVIYSNVEGKETWTVTSLPSTVTHRYLAGMEKANKNTSTRDGQYIFPFSFTAELK